MCSQNLSYCTPLITQYLQLWDSPLTGLQNSFSGIAQYACLWKWSLWHCSQILITKLVRLPNWTCFYLTLLYAYQNQVVHMHFNEIKTGRWCGWISPNLLACAARPPRIGRSQSAWEFSAWIGVLLATCLLADATVGCCDVLANPLPPYGRLHHHGCPRFPLPPWQPRPHRTPSHHWSCWSPSRHLLPIVDVNVIWG